MSMSMKYRDMLHKTAFAAGFLTGKAQNFLKSIDRQVLEATKAAPRLLLAANIAAGFGAGCPAPRIKEISQSFFNAEAEIVGKFAGNSLRAASEAFNGDPAVTSIEPEPQLPQYTPQPCTDCKLQPI